MSELDDFGIPDNATFLAESKGQKAKRKVDVKLPAADAVIDPKAGWVRVVIDEVRGMNNSEEVGVNGKVYQIRRGVPTLVPPEVVHALENAMTTIIEQRFNRMTGEYEDVPHVAASIPWRKA